MMPSVVAMAIDGRMAGTMTYRNRPQIPAPSSAAASSTSIGTLASPAR